VNRSLDSRLGIEGLRINRLMSWSAMRFEFVAVTGGTRPFRAGEPSFMVRCELDINTAPDFPSPLPMGSAPDLLREFADVATEILITGAP